MRNPNGYGTVIKLSGKRRKPYATRKVIGWNIDGKPIYKYIGYYATYKDAVIGLADYNKNPYSIVDKPTLEEVWKRYSERNNPAPAIRSTFKKFEPIQDKKLQDIRLSHVQCLIDDATPSTQRAMKTLFTNLERYAERCEIATKDIGKLLECDDIEHKERKIIPEDTIKRLWERCETEYIADALILIYMGWRISEYLELTTDNIHDNFICGGKKTESGKNRYVPIHPRIMTLIEKKALNGQNNALCGYDVATLKRLWERDEDLSPFTFHECRHTFRTRLDNVNANAKCMDLMMGHKSKEVGVRVYTHKTLEQLQAEILKLE